MDFTTKAPFGKKETWYLLALTGNKIQHESCRAERDLCRLAVLCNTFDKNILTYQEMGSETETERLLEDAPPAYEFCEHSAASASYGTFDDANEIQTLDHFDDSDDSEEWEHSDDESNESDDSSEAWEAAEVIDGVLPLADERREQWLSTYREDADVHAQDGGYEADPVCQEPSALSGFDECHVAQVSNSDTCSKEVASGKLFLATKQDCGRTSRFVECVVAVGNLVLPKTERLVEKYQNLII
ncbi:hypothetical protein K458DRAFT_484517 [Lentithecium fluviatile CBS 122367]|uniref:Uncharacterized protein n=1 Tax=Lentithecium fluviatile CBS 122367 TaxID=1168545 RepID=A0A6G1JDA8_9PLEO|nr:hypothetical protein K458DRAFT_484517 [Lentithecium fluviatile CBS 122367]